MPTLTTKQCETVNQQCRKLALLPPMYAGMHIHVCVCVCVCVCVHVHVHVHVCAREREKEREREDASVITKQPEENLL